MCNLIKKKEIPICVEVVQRSKLSSIISSKRRNLSIVKLLFYFTILVGFLGCTFSIIDVGPFSLFPFRLFLPILWILFLLNIFINHGKISVSHIKIKPYIYFLILWLFYAILSLAWAHSKIDALKEIITILMGISVIFFAVFYFTHIEDFKLFFKLWLLVLVVSICVGMWNYFTGHSLNSDWIVMQLPKGRFRPTSLYSFPNIFAVFLSLSIPFLIAFIRYHKKLIIKISGVGILLLAFHLLIATGTRSAYLAVFLSILFHFLFLQKLKLKFKLLAIMVIIILLVSVFFPQYGQNIIRVVDGVMVSIFSEWGTQGTSVYFRKNMIKNSFLFFIKSGGIGIGAGNLEYYMRRFGVYDVNGNPYGHNWWMQILANYGIFILGCYIVFYVNLILNLYREHGKLIDDSERMICEALLMGLVGFFFAGMSTGTIMNFIPQWIFFAFALSFLNYCKINRSYVAIKGSSGLNNKIEKKDI